MKTGYYERLKKEGVSADRLNSNYSNLLASAQGVGPKDDLRLNSNESIFFARELEYRKAQIIDVIYQVLKAAKSMPVSMEAPDWVEYITWTQYDKVGQAKIITNASQDLPRVDVKGAQMSGQVRTLGSAYGYNLQEIKASNALGKSLDSRRSMTSNEANARLMDNLAWFGDPNNNLQGFINAPNITQVTIPNGAAGHTQWATKTADEIVSDLIAISSAIPVSTKGIETPNRMIMPIDQYLLASQIRLPNTAISALDYFLDVNPFIEEVDWINELAGAGAEGSDRLMCYRKDPLKFTMEIPLLYQQLEPEKRGLEYVVDGISRFGGVLIYKPMSIAYADGI